MCDYKIYVIQLFIAWARRLLVNIGWQKLSLKDLDIAGSV